MAILAFRLMGPLAAWGTGEAGLSRRPSARQPGRSAILGLLAAAVGYSRTNEAEHQALAKAVRIAVAGHGPRRILDDFQITQSVNTGNRGATFASRREGLLWAEAQEPSKLVRKPSQREYITGGLWRVFVACTPEKADPSNFLGQLAGSLQKPRFELYLGRRCCPLSLPPMPELIDAGSLSTAIDCYPALPQFGRTSLLGRSLAQIQRSLVDRHPMELTWDEDFPGAPEPDSWSENRDEPLSRSRRTFALCRTGSRYFDEEDAGRR